MTTAGHEFHSWLVESKIATVFPLPAIRVVGTVHVEEVIGA